MHKQQSEEQKTTSLSKDFEAHSPLNFVHTPINLQPEGNKDQSEDTGTAKPNKIEDEKKLNILLQNRESNRFLDHIPCLYLPYDDGSSKLLVYFHGNAEDIGLAFDMLFLIGQKL